MRRIEASDIKARYTVLDVWRMLMPHSCPAKDGVYHSPFRDDRTPSFSVSRQGTRWKDFASDQGGDCIDFYALATGCSTADAIQKLAEGLGQAPVLPPPPPKRKPVHVVTAEQRELEQRVSNNINAFILDATCVGALLFGKKQIHQSAAISLWREGSLGAIDGKPVYLYPFGSKIRHELESSRSTRWLVGGDCGYVWRHQCLASPHLKQIIICEGETDAMRLMSLVPQGLRTLIVAAPGASWKPSKEYCHFIGAHRSVTLWFDNDTAGIKASERLLSQFGEVSHCNVRRVEFLPGDGKDVCLMPEQRVLQLFADYCCA
jgi:DNA primase